MVIGLARSDQNVPGVDLGAHTDNAQGGDGALLAQGGGTGLQGCIQCIGNFFAK